LGIGRGDVVAVVSDGAIIVGHCWRGRCKEAQWEQQAASVGFSLVFQLKESAKAGTVKLVANKKTGGVLYFIVLGVFALLYTGVAKIKNKRLRGD